MNGRAANSNTQVRPPFDPELAAALAAVKAGIPKMSPELLLELRRMQGRGVLGAGAQDLTAGGSIRAEERSVPGPEGQPEVTVLILSPVGGGKGLPGIYYIHGGGMVLGDRRLGVEWLLPSVREGRAVVVSVEYRLAPEHPDPAPVQDSYAGLVWMAKNAGDLGLDPDRIMIAGGSAGGGLAAGTALLARDHGFPQLTHQMLICPMLDDREQTYSSRMLVSEGVWTSEDNRFGWTSLLGRRRGGPDVSDYASPARATDLSGLPRTYIDCGSAETFRDEILDYATRLSEAGVSVDLHMWGGGFHGFDLFVPYAAISRASIATRDEFLRRALEA